MNALKLLIGRFRANEYMNCTRCIHSKLVSIGPPLDREIDMSRYREERLKPFYECVLKRKKNIGPKTVCIRFSKGA